MTYIFKRSAFSLVELSIVLVILGLLTGGILTGQSLIHAAEMRSMASDIQQYQTAIMSFRDRYFAYPGDLTNATDFWGTAAGTTGSDATCFDSTSTAGTCNGNGDGIVGYNSMTGGSLLRYEWFRAWQHLAYADLIQGEYTGIGNEISASVHAGCNFGTNCPALKINNAGVQYRHAPAVVAGTVGVFPQAAGNRFLIGATNSSNAGSNPDFAFLTPEDAWNYDKKVDDGLPGKGRVKANATPDNVISWGTTTKDCATSSDPVDAEYDLASSDIKCALVVQF